MNVSAKLEELKSQLETELELGSKEAEDNLQPFIQKLEAEMSEAKEKWAQLEEASENSWEDIKSGLDLSIDAMKEAFSSAKKHFSNDKTS